MAPSIANLAFAQRRVLPPGEFNGMIPQPLAVYSESFMTIQ